VEEIFWQLALPPYPLDNPPTKTSRTAQLARGNDLEPATRQPRIPSMILSKPLAHHLPTPSEITLLLTLPRPGSLTRRQTHLHWHLLILAVHSRPQLLQSPCLMLTLFLPLQQWPLSQPSLKTSLHHHPSRLLVTAYQQVPLGLKTFLHLLAQLLPVLLQSLAQSPVLLLALPLVPPWPLVLTARTHLQTMSTVFNSISSLQCKTNWSLTLANL